MDQLQTTAGFHHPYTRQLHAIISTPDVHANHLVLAAANAIMLHEPHLFEAVRQRAQQVNAINPAGTDDEHILSYIFSVSRPFNLIHHRVTTHGWPVSFNEFRALRPTRDAVRSINALHKQFDPKSFNFNVVPREAFWRGTFRHRRVSLFYNKFPIERYHSLIVPDPEARQEQFLEPADHALAWDAQAVLSRHQPRLVIAYNAHGAGESVNHLHFQIVPSTSDLPLMRKSVQEHYPIPVAEFSSPEAAWRHIHRLQSENRAFNAVYLPGRALIIERAFQGHYQTPSWTNGFGWYELMGGILTLDERAYRSLTDDQIAAVFADITPR